ncbi:MAG: hypothetical protein ACJA1I_001396 [Zhongshania marina]|jgi:hypothetical protein
MKPTSILAIPFIAAMSLGANAQNTVKLDDITMNVIDSANIDLDGDGKQGELHEIVVSYMLENGGITQQEFDQAAAEHKANYADIKALKEGGDKKALLSKLTEGRTSNEKLKGYIPESDDLAVLIESAKQQWDGNAQNLVVAYMLENGDLTETDINVAKEELKDNYNEIKELKQSGNEEAVAAQLAELREASLSTVEDIKTYIDSHEDLALAVQEQRDAAKDRLQSRDRSRR